MKRTYRVEVEFEATFERKIASRSWAKRIQQACTKVAPAGWSVVGAQVRSRAIPKACPPPPPDPQESVRGSMLDQLQAIATAMSRFVVAAPNPRVWRVPNRYCKSVDRTHAHITPGPFYRRSEGGAWKRLGKSRGVICVPNATLDRLATGTYHCNPEELMLHEVAHLRFRTGHDHDGHRYQESIERLERDYYLNVVDAQGGTGA